MNKFTNMQVNAYVLFRSFVTLKSVSLTSVTHAVDLSKTLKTAKCCVETEAGLYYLNFSIIKLKNGGSVVG